MNVLFLTPRFGENNGGDSLYATKLALGLSRRGYRVEVLTILEGRFVLGTPDLRLGGEDGLTVRDTFGPVPSNEFSRNFYSISARRSVAEGLRRVQPDVIHSHGIHQYFTASCLEPLRESGLPILLTMHDYKLLCGNAGFFSDRRNEPCLRCLRGGFLPPIAERCKKGSLLRSAATSVQMGLWHAYNALDLVTRIHAPSAFVAELLSRNKKVSSKVTVSRYPVMLPDTWTEDEEPKEPAVVFVGRMVPHKGGRVFAEAVKSLNVPIELFGDGVERSPVEQILGDRRDVTFHGWVSHARMKNSLGDGTIVVLPYLAHETFCFAVLEAMARGCCVVTTSRGAIPELVRHKHNGILVDEPTPSRFRSEIRHLLDNPDEVRRLGRNARSIVGELTDLSDHINDMMTVYASLTAGKR